MPIKNNQKKLLARYANSFFYAILVYKRTLFLVTFSYLSFLSMTILQTHDLYKQFRTKLGTVNAVQGITIDVHKGEIFGFLGPNGAGKTTTMRMLTTLLEPSGGHAVIAGYNLLTQPQKVREHIGYISQLGGLEESVTARENLVLQAQLYGMTLRQAHTRSQELIAALALETFADRLVKTYSGGQRRRTDLALGMVHNPALLFIDEPTVGLDPQSRAHFWHEIRQMRDRGTTIFLTTHYLDEADALCDRLAIIDQGTLVTSGTPTELKKQVAGDMVLLGINPASSAQASSLLQGKEFINEIHILANGLRLYVGAGEQAMPHILRILDHAHIGLDSIALARPTLDDVFLHYTGRFLRDETTEAS